MVHWDERYLLPRLSDQPYVAIDTETTGKNVNVDAVVEIAALRFQCGEVVDRYVSLVDPTIPIPPEASEIHRLTNRDVRDAPDLETVQERLDNFVGDNLVVAHYAQFDSEFCPALGDREWLCTLRAARHTWPHAPAHRLQYLRFWLPLESAALDGTPAHRAEADALAAGLVMHRMLQKYEIAHPSARLDDFANFVREPLAVVRLWYGRKHRGEPISDIPVAYLQWMLAAAGAPDRDRRFKMDDDTVAAIERSVSERRLGTAA